MFCTYKGITRKNFGDLNKFIRIKIKNRKRDSEDYQRFVSEEFYSGGFRFWTKFLAVLRFLAIFCAVSRFLIGPYAPLRQQSHTALALPVHKKNTPIYN